MLERPLRWLSVLATLVVLAGWVAFAVTETSDASKVSVAEVGGTTTTSRPADPDASHGGVRGALDRADDALLAPFSMLAGDAANPWVEHSVPAIAAVLVYGLGLGYLARFTRGRA